MKIKFKNLIIAIVAILFLAGCMREAIPEGKGSVSYQKKQNDIVDETIILYYDKNKVEEAEIISNLYYSEMRVDSEFEAIGAFNKYMENVELIEGITIELLDTKSDYLVQKMKLDFGEIDQVIVESIFDDGFFIYEDGNVSYIKTIKELKNKDYKKEKID